MKHSRWEDLYDAAASIIHQTNATYPLVDNWSLGGGTALMLHIDHRESFDVDIFLDDPQLLPYLNPQTQGYTLPAAPHSYVSDGSRTLKVVFEHIGEIDFICAPSMTELPTQLTKLRNRIVRLETPAEILAKKIVYRGTHMQPRDMFDIAAVIKANGTEYVFQTLKPFRHQCERALAAARRMNPLFAQSIMEKLLYREAFGDIPENAQAMTISLLQTVCVQDADSRNT